MNDFINCLLMHLFGINNYRNSITWQRNAAKGNSTKNYPRNSDIILYYTKSDDYTFNPQYKELSDSTKNQYRYKDEFERKYKLVSTTAASINGLKEWNIDGKIFKFVGPKTRSFAWTQETLDRKRKEHFEKYGTELIKISDSGALYQIKYLEDSKGILIDNIWTDFNALKSHKEKLGYPTQKPEALLERIILSSTN